MRTTGIVRRIDDLGRIVIPNDIRWKLGIEAGDPIEFFITEDSVILTKYRTQKLKYELEKYLRNYANNIPTSVAKIIGAAIDLLDDEDNDNSEDDD